MIIIEWILNALIILAAAYLIPGFRVKSFGWALILVLILGVLNVLVKPSLLLLSLPVNFLTLGLFTLVINAFVLWLAAALTPGVESGFWSAFWASIVISLLSAMVGVVFYIR